MRGEEGKGQRGNIKVQNENSTENREYRRAVTGGERKEGRGRREEREDKKRSEAQKHTGEEREVEMKESKERKGEKMKESKEERMKKRRQTQKERRAGERENGFSSLYVCVNFSLSVCLSVSQGASMILCTLSVSTRKLLNFWCATTFYY